MLEVIFRPSTYTHYFKKIWAESQALSHAEGRSKLFYFCDYLHAFMRHGATLRQYSAGGFHKMHNFERSRCVTYRRWEKMLTVFNDPSQVHIFENKAEFNKRFAQFNQRGWLYLKECTQEQFLQMVRPGCNYILKPLDEWEGHGVRKLTSAETTDPAATFAQLKGTDVIVEEFINQHPSMNFGNASVNTLRVMSVWDKRQGKALIYKAILRVGVGDSVIDNYCSGGLIYPVNIATGVVEAPGIGKKYGEQMFHPGTSICMLGFKIPNWDKVVETVNAAAGVVPQVRFVGWDVAITPSGVELVEGNHNPDYELIEFLGDNAWYQKIMNVK